MRRRNGFTLVELLVVIGIIAVLISIHAPLRSAIGQRPLRADRQGHANEHANLAAGIPIHVVHMRQVGF